MHLDAKRRKTKAGAFIPPRNEAAAPAARPAPIVTPAVLSPVERQYLERSGRKLCYSPTEKIGIIEVEDFPSLGRLTALRFLEWAAANPEGVLSLPTGKTPEYFIRWTQHYLQKWDEAGTRAELEQVGLGDVARPALGGLRFVQIDEFYPIDPQQHNSFHYYVSKYYLRGLGLDPARAMLIDPTAIGIPAGETIDTLFPEGRVDLSLRSRRPKTLLEQRQADTLMAVDQFCADYETRVRELGGLGFFLGGIGPDGHIGFNPRGSHSCAPTRLTLTNYETEAAAAGDLGGIEVSRNRPVITIGLATITYNPQATVIVFAAGEAKAPIVADSIQHGPSVLYPASALQGMPNARFYLTRGATVWLTERRLEDILKAEQIGEEQVERAAIDAALALGRSLDQIRDEDRAALPAGRERAELEATLRRSERQLGEVAGWTRQRLIEKLERGLGDIENASILHTGPHHDDIMLGYMPYVMHLVRRISNRNSFYVLTSGFTAVTNGFMATLLRELDELLATGAFEPDIAAGDLELDKRTARAAEVYRFLDGIAARDEALRRRAQARRTLANLISIYEDENVTQLRQRIAENINYLSTLYPGKKDIVTIQKLKGMQREYEEELIWAYVGTDPADVAHGRLGFYTGDIFTQQPTAERDVAPVLERLLKIEPTHVSLAFDPEGSGPDTHYKVLQVLHEALLRYRERTGKAPLVWGYRNVWYKFHPAAANIYIPATLNTMAVMEHAFMHCFGSQCKASFPSHEYDGPFCYQTQEQWVQQFAMIKTCLGERFFIENPHPRLRATRGLVFLKQMTLDEFSGAARRLANLTEGV